MSQENLNIFAQLYENKEQIEKAFGGPLVWMRLEGKKACSIRIVVQGGYGDPEESWATTHDLIADAMNRLVNALGPHIKALRIEGFVEKME